MNENIFEEIFWEVAEEHGVSGWWELFDSEDFEEVERRIAERFGVADPCEVEGFIEWNNEMAEEL